MMNKWPLITITFLCLVLIPFVPQMLRFKIRVRRRLHWHWGADLIEHHFEGWVSFVRILLLIMAAVLLYIGWTQ